jgi:hypothetical protein
MQSSSELANFEMKIQFFHLFLKIKPFTLNALTGTDFGPILLPKVNNWVAPYLFVSNCERRNLFLKSATL